MLCGMKAICYVSNVQSAARYTSIDGNSVIVISLIESGRRGSDINQSARQWHEVEQGEEASCICSAAGWPRVIQVCYARILDAKRKFLEAALKYYDLSQLDKHDLGGRWETPCH